jgi:cytochrome b561/polyisoprenoid-binding protein YceI
MSDNAAPDIAIEKQGNAGLVADQKRYSAVAMALHWLIAAALAFQMGLGGGLEDLTPQTGLFAAAQLHKSIGISILLLSLLRLGWRWYKPPPAALPDSRVNHWLAHMVHIGLYAFMIGAPLSGWLLVSSSKLGIDTYIFSTLYWPHIPFVGDLEASTKAALNGIAGQAHHYLGWMGLALFVLHIIGALRHQFIKDEPLLARIWPGVWGARKIAGSAVIIGAFAVMFTLSGLAQGLYGSGGAGGDGAEETTEKAAITSEKSEDGYTAIEPKNIPIIDVDLAEDAEAIGEDLKDAENAADAADGDSTAQAAEPEAVAAPQAAIAYDWKVTSAPPIRFSFDWNGEAVSGTFSDWNADIRFGPEALDQSRIAVNINLASAKTGNGQIDDALPGADFFAAAANPQARFVSSDIRSSGGDNYEARGTLTLKGISKPLTLRFTLAINADVATAKGSTAINRSAYNVAIGSYGDISPNVKVNFTLAAKR